jgi:hypothetical protein
MIANINDNKNLKGTETYNNQIGPTEDLTKPRTVESHSNSNSVYINPIDGIDPPSGDGDSSNGNGTFEYPYKTVNYAIERINEATSTHYQKVLLTITKNYAVSSTTIDELVIEEAIHRLESSKFTSYNEIKIQTELGTIAKFKYKGDISTMFGTSGKQFLQIANKGTEAIACATDGTVYRSEDYGTTWSQVTVDTGVYIYCVCFEKNGDSFYAAGDNGSGINRAYKSETGATGSWTNLNIPPVTAHATTPYRIEAVYDYGGTSRGYVYVICGKVVLYGYHNSGTWVGWQGFTPNLFSADKNDIVVDPEHPEQPIIISHEQVNNDVFQHIYRGTLDLTMVDPGELHEISKIEYYFSNTNNYMKKGFFFIDEDDKKWFYLKGSPSATGEPGDATRIDKTYYKRTLDFINWETISTNINDDGNNPVYVRGNVIITISSYQNNFQIYYSENAGITNKLIFSKINSSMTPRWIEYVANRMYLCNSDNGSYDGIVHFNDYIICNNTPKSLIVYLNGFILDGNNYAIVGITGNNSFYDRLNRYNAPYYTNINGQISSYQMFMNMKYNKIINCMSVAVNDVYPISNNPDNISHNIIGNSYISLLCGTTGTKENIIINGTYGMMVLFLPDNQLELMTIYNCSKLGLWINNSFDHDFHIYKGLIITKTPIAIKNEDSVNDVITNSVIDGELDGVDVGDNVYTYTPALFRDITADDYRLMHRELNYLATSPAVKLYSASRDSGAWDISVADKANNYKEIEVPDHRAYVKWKHEVVAASEDNNLRGDLVATYTKYLWVFSCDLKQAATTMDMNKIKWLQMWSDLIEFIPSGYGSLDLYTGGTLAYCSWEGAAVDSLVNVKIEDPTAINNLKELAEENDLVGWYIELPNIAGYTGDLPSIIFKILSYDPSNNVLLAENISTSYPGNGFSNPADGYYHAVLQKGLFAYYPKYKGYHSDKEAYKLELIEMNQLLTDHQFDNLWIMLYDGGGTAHKFRIKENNEDTIWFENVNESSMASFSDDTHYFMQVYGIVSKTRKPDISPTQENIQGLKNGGELYSTNESRDETDNVSSLSTNWGKGYVIDFVEDEGGTDEL